MHHVRFVSSSLQHSPLCLRLHLRLHCVFLQASVELLLQHQAQTARRLDAEVFHVVDGSQAKESFLRC
jgi:hypothetical protein